jgi:hypothetical protein
MAFPYRISLLYIEIANIEYSNIPCNSSGVGWWGSARGDFPVLPLWGFPTNSRSIL